MIPHRELSLLWMTSYTLEVVTYNTMHVVLQVLNPSETGSTLLYERSLNFKTLSNRENMYSGFVFSKFEVTGSFVSLIEAVMIIPRP